MTSTSQKTEKKEAETKESDVKVASEKAPETQSTSTQQKGERTVPVAALADEREKRQEANAKLEQLEKELAALKASKAPDPHQPNPSDDSDVRHALKDLQERDRRRTQEEQKQKLAVELGLTSSEQVDAVSEIRSKNPDLSSVEAMEMAARRKPDLFKDRGARGFDPAIHGSARPQATGSPPAPQKSDYKRRLEAMKKTTGKQQMDLFYDQVGTMAQRAMGWGERQNRIPIPE